MSVFTAIGHAMVTALRLPGHRDARVTERRRLDTLFERRRTKLKATRYSIQAESNALAARDFDLGGGFHYSGSYPMVFPKHSALLAVRWDLMGLGSPDPVPPILRWF